MPFPTCHLEMLIISSCRWTVPSLELCMACLYWVTSRNLPDVVSTCARIPHFSQFFSNALWILWKMSDIGRSGSTPTCRRTCTPLFSWSAAVQKYCVVASGFCRCMEYLNLYLWQGPNCQVAYWWGNGSTRTQADDPGKLGEGGSHDPWLPCQPKHLIWSC